jgi:hypothetical protein
MGNQLKAGPAFPALRARTIHDRELAIPDPGRWVHLQFRRFAGCPVCNLHLQAFARRHGRSPVPASRKWWCSIPRTPSCCPIRASFPSP